MIDEPLSPCLSKTQLDVIAQAEVLIIGAGGIGCELLKTLALSGFKQLHVVDLDTIDRTNLNRQFLFRENDVGQSKSFVARDAIRRLCPQVEITAYHANINDADFNKNFLKRFNLILNALDNNEARRYVNRFCVSLGIPLLDSGSSGYNGQVTPILQNVTKCFECDPSPRLKSFPVCSIRSTPQKPQHCVAWAKVFFELLCGRPDSENLLYDTKQEFDALAEMLEEDSGYQGISKFVFHVFQKVFQKDIEKQYELYQSTDSMLHVKPLLSSDYFNNEFQLKSFARKIMETSCRTKRDPWSIEECVVMFVNSLRELIKIRLKNKTSLFFEKDDATCANFVTAAANLRMYNYNIPALSRWEIESISGSIIPAIASTNAILAGLQTLQAMKLLWYLDKKRKASQPITLQDLAHEGIKHVWVKQFSLGPFLLLPEPPGVPREKCYICQSKRLTVFLHNIQKWTLEDFINIIIKGELSCVDPSVQLLETNLCLFDCEMETNVAEYSKKKKLSLAAWNITNGVRLYVFDSSQESLEFELQIFEDSSLVFKASQSEQLASRILLEDIPLTWLYAVEGSITNSRAHVAAKRILDSSHTDKEVKNVSADSVKKHCEG